MNTVMGSHVENSIQSGVEADWASAIVRIKRLLFSMGVTMPDLEDLVQEVCIKLIGRKAQTNYGGWLRVVVRNVLADFYRREYRRIDNSYESVCSDRIVGVSEEETGTSIATVPSPVKDSLEFDFKEAIAHELSGLEATQKRTMYLYAEGFSYAQIANMTAVSIGTVRSRIHYGKRKLRERLASFL